MKLKETRGSMFKNFYLVVLNRHLSYWPRKVAGHFFFTNFILGLLNRHFFTGQEKSRVSFFFTNFFLVVLNRHLSYWHYHSQVIYRAYFFLFLYCQCQRNGNSVTTNILFLCIIKPLMDLYFAIWTTGVHVFNISVSGMRMVTLLSFAFIISSNEQLN